MQERCGSPSISTVQTPQVPCPQPNFGEVSPTPSRSAVEQVRAAVDEHRDVVAVMLELDGRFHACQPVPAQQALADAPPTISRRYQALAIASVGGLVPSAATATAAAMPLSSSALAFERALDRLRPHRRRRHRAIGDARARDAPAVQRQVRGDREHRNAFRLHARHLAEAERAPGSGRLNVTLATRPLRALAVRQEIPPAASRGPNSRPDIATVASSASSATVKSP